MPGGPTPTAGPAVVEEADVVHYLLDVGLLSARHIIDGSLRITSAGGRNLNFRVTAASGPAYLVKRSRDSDDSVSHEAAVYRYLHGLVHTDDFAQVLPRVVAWCQDSLMLVLEYVDGADLRRHHTRIGRCPLPLAAQCGTVLAAMHALPTAAVSSALWSTLTRDEAGFAAHRPDEQLFATSSRAVVDLVALMQADRDLCTALDALTDDWRPVAFTHHDVRWDNILIARAEAGRAPLRLIDWEAAGIGDPDWDLGCLFAEYVSHWLVSIPLTTAATAADHIHLARYPLGEAQKAIRKVWACYAERLGIAAANRRSHHLRQATRYVGPRLVQRALELDQQSTVMSVAAVCHIQVAARILADPDSAVTGLLGLPG